MSFPRRTKATLGGVVGVGSWCRVTFCGDLRLHRCEHLQSPVDTCPYKYLFISADVHSARASPCANVCADPQKLSIKNSKLAIKRNEIVLFADRDRPRDCHTEWSKSEREKQISYNISYMWNLEKWYRWTYLQSRDRDTEVENKCMDTKGVVGWTGRLGLACTHYYV